MGLAFNDLRTTSQKEHGGATGFLFPESDVWNGLLLKPESVAVRG